MQPEAIYINLGVWLYSYGVLFTELKSSPDLAHWPWSADLAMLSTVLRLSVLKCILSTFPYLGASVGEGGAGEQEVANVAFLSFTALVCKKFIWAFTSSQVHTYIHPTT